MHFDEVEQVVLGRDSPTLAKFKGTGKLAGSFFKSGPEPGAPTAYNIAGFLMKKGGTKGGLMSRRNWTKVRAPRTPPVPFALCACCPLLNPSCVSVRVQRWHVLQGNTVEYFKQPTDAKPKGSFSISGVEVKILADSKYPNTFEVRCVQHGVKARTPPCAHCPVSCLMSS